MEIQKKVMKYSALVTGIMFVISILLEWDILKNIKMPYCFSVHNSFILNYIISITASGILTFVIAWVSYLVEKKKIIVSYYQNISSLLYQMKITEFFLFEHLKDNNIVIKQEEIPDLYYHLEKTYHILDTLINIGLEYYPIFPLYKRNYFGKNKKGFYFIQQKFHSFCVNLSLNINGFIDYNELLRNFSKLSKDDGEMEILKSNMIELLREIERMTNKNDEYYCIVNSFGEELQKKLHKKKLENRNNTQNM